MRCGTVVQWGDRWDAKRVLLDAAPSPYGDMIVVARIDDGRVVVTRASRDDPKALPRFRRHRSYCGVARVAGVAGVAAYTASASR